MSFPDTFDIIKTGRFDNNKNFINLGFAVKESTYCIYIAKFTKSTLYLNYSYFSRLFDYFVQLGILTNDDKPKSRSSKQTMHSNYEVYNLTKKQYNRLIMYLKIKGIYEDEY